MESKNLVICDKEEGYAAAFARYVMRKDELALQVQTCSDISHVLSIQEKSEIDYLFISSDYPLQKREQTEAKNVFVLTGNENVVTGERETVLYKYQSGEEILAELIRRCGTQELEGNTFLKTFRKKEVRIIGVYSPIHRIGKTSFALELGERLAREANVLYLSLETYGGIGGHFAEGGQNLSDVLYYAKQEKGNLGLLLTTIVKHKGNLDYVAPIQVSEDLKGISAEEWINVIQRIIEQSIYEVLILDMDEGVREIYPLLQSCSEIYMLTADDMISRSKLRQFEEELTLLGYEDIRRRIIKKEQKI